MQTLKELMAEATPLPLEMDETGTVIWGNMDKEALSYPMCLMFSESMTPTERHKADAALIVHCVNTYAELVEALEPMVHGTHYITGAQAERARVVLAKANNIN